MREMSLSGHVARTGRWRIRIKFRGDEFSVFVKFEEFLDWLSTCQLHAMNFTVVVRIVHYGCQSKGTSVFFLLWLPRMNMLCGWSDVFGLRISWRLISVKSVQSVSVVRRLGGEWTVTVVVIISLMTRTRLVLLAPLLAREKFIEVTYPLSVPFMRTDGRNELFLTGAISRSTIAQIAIWIIAHYTNLSLRSLLKPNSPYLKTSKSFINT